MENEKEFFKLYPSVNDNYFWNNVSSGASGERNARAVISARFQNFNALEILEAGEDKPILNIEGLMKFMNNPKYERDKNIGSIISLVQKVYHYLPEQMFRIFVISQNEDPKYETAQYLANKCLHYYITHGGDLEFIKLGIYRAEKDFIKNDLSKKILEFDKFKVFKTIKFLKSRMDIDSLYDDAFKTATGIFYLKEDLKHRNQYYNENTISQMKTDIEKGNNIIKKMIKNFDQNMLLNYIKTKKTFLKEQSLDLIAKMNKIENSNFDDDETYFHCEDQIELLENQYSVCDFLENIAKETEFVNNSNYNESPRKPTDNKTKAEKVSTKAD